ncbi:hypothetical protein Vadar_013208 [Vaccinium darrowii]|uniref:Uncharacterized protein n=1 Tax=Vaccinium darrowii TaxID=229202 RepID=A0ACB7YEE5_9ERIC|nr:hypothetical protein Vadar_013208 [Vaccinium darrowii]
MSNPLIVVDKIVEYIVWRVCRRVGFLFHYKKNLKNLEDEKNNLQQQISNIQEKVNEAKHRGEAIDNNVSVWLDDANESNQEVDAFLDEKTVKENMHCFNFSCPDFISRYCLSKQAKKKAVCVKLLAENGSKIGTVSRPREDPPELELPSCRDYEDFHSRQKVFKGIVEALKDSKVNIIGVNGTGGVGIPIQDGNNRCKIVLTSRNRDVWKNMDVYEDFHVTFLSEEEGWTLFKKKVGNHVDSHNQPLCDIAWAVCKECEGLPVAINALGAALMGKDIYAWQDALDKLKNSLLKDVEGINPKVYSSLKWSYDWLDSEDAKSCFLLCCLFPEDYEIPIDNLVRYYMAGRMLRSNQMPDTLEKALARIQTVVSTLKSCCLLIDGKRKHFVKMHDVVRDVGISIAKDEKSFLVQHGVRYWPQKATYEHCSVISLMPNDMREFPSKLICSELHTLRLDCTNNNFQLQVPDRFFIGMENLMVLDLNGVIMSPLLPTSLAKLGKLQMLCLNECNLGDISILKDLKDHLEMLSLRGSNIEVLPQEVEELAHLRLLDLSNCHKLRMIPKGVISKLFHLEELYMPQNFHQWKGTSVEREINNVSLDELTLLTKLTTLHICVQDPALLPKEGFFFENLVRFRITVGEKSNYHDWDSTGVLRLENVHVANALEYLLGKTKRERSIERNGLYASTSFNHLVELCVTNCTLKYLFSPSIAKGLVQLHKLEITSLPNLISFYPKKEKTATSSGSLSTRAQKVLFNDKVAFPELESLDIVSVPKLTEIWNKQILPIPEIATESSFCQLSRVSIHGCRKLMNVVGGYPKTEAIVMEKQKGKEVDDYVHHFPKLRALTLTYLRKLKSFCKHRSRRNEAQVPLFDHQVAFPALEKLHISDLPKITDIWDKKIRPDHQPFCPLGILNVGNCGKLVNVVPSNMLPQLRNLESLSLDLCPLVEVIIDLEKEGEETQEAAHNTIVPLPELRRMSLGRLKKIKGFCAFRSAEQPVFNVQVAFPKLRHIDIYTFGETALRHVMDVSELSLKCLQFLNCDEISTVVSPHVLRRLQFVDLLIARSCRGAREVFDFDGVEVGDDQERIGPSWLMQVRMVDLYNLRQLTCLWNKDPCGLLDLQNLEYLTIKKCPHLANLFTASVAKALGGLKVLYLSSCSTMEAVIATDEEHLDDGDEIEFPKLEWLILKDLSHLKSFCTSNHNFNLPSLKRVVLKRCPKMQTFTSGAVRMPQILLSTRGNECLTIEDLNKHLEQQHLKGDQENIVADEMYGDEEQFSLLSAF